MTSNKPIKQLILDRIAGRIDGQNEKGLKTYGHTLEECPGDKYDWRDMMIEELIDCNQYAFKMAIEAQKEVGVLTHQVNQLNATIEEMKRNHVREINKVYSYGR